jgi:hypothetical protein
LERLQPGASLPELVDSLLAEFYESTPLGHVENKAWDDEGRLKQRREQILFLLEGHPAPWNQTNTVRSLSELIAASLPEQSDEGDAVPLTEADERRRIAMAAAWPNQLTPCFPIEAFGDIASAARQSRAEHGDSWGEGGPLTKSQLLEARDAVRQIDNPIGTLVEWANWPSDGVQKLCWENWQAASELELLVRRKLHPPLLTRLKRLFQTRRRNAG